MSCLVDLLVKFSPRRVGVFLHSQPTFARKQQEATTERSEHEHAVELQQRDEDAAGEQKKQQQQQQDDDEVDFYDGLEVIKKLPTTQMPDPRLNVGGHVVSSLFWYGVFALFLAMIVDAFFLSHELKQSVSVAPMSSMAPKVKIALSVVCTETAENATAAALLKSERKITLSLQQNYNSNSSSSCASGSKTLVATKTEATAAGGSVFTFNGTMDKDVFLCYVSSSKAFSPLAKNAQTVMEGTSLAVEISSIANGVTTLPTCYVDLLATQDAAPKDSSSSSSSLSSSPWTLVRRMNLQSSPPELRTLKLGYFEHTDTSAHRSGLPGNKVRLEAGDRYIFPTMFDLEGLRRAGQPSVLAIRFAETGISSSSVDDRSVSGFVGEFGTVWRCAELSLFWTGPVVLCIFSMDFLNGGGLEQLPEGSKDLLMKTWQPLYGTWIVGLVLRVLTKK